VRPGWQRVVLLVAAAWNLVGGTLALLDPAQQFAQLFNGALVMSDPIQLFFYRCTWINVMAWGLAYLIAAFPSASRVPVLLAGGIGKLFYFVACLSLFYVGAGTAALLGAGLVDLILAVLFLVAVFTRRAPSSVAIAPQPAPAQASGAGPPSAP
jgi:hypothetical protein